MYQSRSSSLYDKPLDNTMLAKLAPSIFAENAHERTSARYTFIPTIQVVDALRAEGWEPVKAMQSIVRDLGRAGFQKHMLRFRHRNNLTLDPTQMLLGETIPEIVLVNGHDGSSTYQIHGGLFRLICHNGMVVADSTIEKVVTRHSGNIINDVIEGTYHVIEEVPKVVEKIDSWKSITLDAREQDIFGQAALLLRWDEDKAPINERQVLGVRREEDSRPDLWTTFNRVQENIMRGGIRGIGSTGRRTRTREVKSVTENVKLNKALWTLTDEFAKLVESKSI